MDRVIAVAVVVGTLLVVPAGLGASAAAQAPGVDEGNGIVLMVHGHVQPSPTEPTPAPPVQEAFLTTPDGDEVVFHAIPYTVEDGEPVVVEQPEMTVDPLGPADSFESTPNADPHGNPVCEEETGLPGHEGPTEACLVFRIPTDEFAAADAVNLELSFQLDGQAYTEPYNEASHVLLHLSFDGAPVTLAQADAAGGQPTPFAVDSGVDPG